MGHVRNIRASYEKVLDTRVYTFKGCRKQISPFKKNTQFDKPFSMLGVADEYDMLFETLRGRICGAWKCYEAYAGAQKMTPEQEKVISFDSDQIETDKISGHCQILPLARVHVLLSGDKSHKGSCSKNHKAVFKYIMIENIFELTSGNLGEADNTY